MKSLPSLVVLLFLLVAFPPGATGQGERRPDESPLYLAQNTQNARKEKAADKEADKEKETGFESIPLPPAKFSITTEKPVKGMPWERTTAGPPAEGKPVESPAGAVGQPAEQEKKAAQAPGSEETPGTPAPPPGTPPSVSTAPGKTPAKEEKSGVPPDIREQIAKKPGEERESAVLMEELSIVNVPTANLRTMKYVIDDRYGLRGMVYGEEQGYIRICSADDDGNFKEVWKSPPCNSPIRGIFVNDLDGDGESEIVAYTADGNIFIYGYNSHDLIYRTPEGTYQNINCMVIANMDGDPQKELFFIGVKPGVGGGGSGNPAGNFVQFDPKTQFEEWVSADVYTATDMIIGNVDTDPEPEIILNTGEILNMRFKDVEWRSTVELGSRLYLIDMDGDGILELVTEYGESYIKIIDVDQRREKW